MIPDEPAPNPSAEHPLPGTVPRRSEQAGGRSAILVLAVAFAAVGLLSLVAILLTAFLQGTVWPGFVLATYVCLPLAFLLMVSAVIRAVVSRRRS